MNDSTSDRPWGPARRMAFRFAALYFLLYSFPFPIGRIPWTESIEEWLLKIWKVFIPWVGAHVLHLEKPITIFPAGSGDTTFNYVQVLVFFVLALLGALVWSVLDRRRISYPKLAGWLTIACRYYVGFFMISYGSFKVIKSQFPYPDLVRLTGTYGDSSPMALLWNFMGYSEPYNIFTGAMEVLGGALLLSRRTTAAGALVTLGVMANVVMLNFSYDVPVKLFSAHLLLFATALALPHLRRLTRFFALNRPTSPADLTPPWNSQQSKWARWSIKAVLIGYLVFANVSMILEGLPVWGDDRPRPPLYGIYDVEVFTRDGETYPPLTTDTERWRLVIVDRPGYLVIRKMDNSLRYFTFEPDHEKGTATFGPRGPNPAEPTTWTFRRPEDGKLTLEGELEGSAYTLELRARNVDELLLPSRGFHWINEYPFNR